MNEENETHPTPRAYASSPCYAHEFEQPPLTREEILILLNELIESERAGAVGIIEMARNAADEAHGSLLHQVGEDEARFCAMLSRHAERLGGDPSRATGVFAEKLARRETLEDKLNLLDKGQSVVVRMLREAIPRIEDTELCGDLGVMRDVHVKNIKRCNELLTENGS